MEPKKSKNKQLERYGGLYTEIGLLIALLLVFSAFKWKAAKPDFNLSLPIEEPIEDGTLPPITEAPIQKPKPPKPIPIKPEVLTRNPTFSFVPNTIDIPFDTVSFELDPDDLNDTEIYSNLGLDTIEEPTPPFALSELPTYPGGITEFHRFLRDNIDYPDWENEMGVGGTVHLKFEIDKKGQVTNIEILKGATQGLNDEALRVANQIPRWNPGKQNGKAVKCWFIQRIVFRAN